MEAGLRQGARAALGAWSALGPRRYRLQLRWRPPKLRVEVAPQRLPIASVVPSGSATAGPRIVSSTNSTDPTIARLLVAQTFPRVLPSALVGRGRAEPITISSTTMRRVAPKALRPSFTPSNPKARRQLHPPRQARRPPQPQPHLQCLRLLPLLLRSRPPRHQRRRWQAARCPPPPPSR